MAATLSICGIPCWQALLPRQAPAAFNPPVVHLQAINRAQFPATLSSHPHPIFLPLPHHTTPDPTTPLPPRPLCHSHLPVPVQCGRPLLRQPCLPLPHQHGQSAGLVHASIQALNQQQPGSNTGRHCRSCLSAYGNNPLPENQRLVWKICQAAQTVQTAANAGPKEEGDPVAGATKEKQCTGRLGACPVAL